MECNQFQTQVWVVTKQGGWIKVKERNPIKKCVIKLTSDKFCGRSTEKEGETRLYCNYKQPNDTNNNNKIKRRLQYLQNHFIATFWENILVTSTLWTNTRKFKSRLLVNMSIQSAHFRPGIQSLHFINWEHSIKYLFLKTSTRILENPSKNMQDLASNNWWLSKK